MQGRQRDNKGLGRPLVGHSKRGIKRSPLRWREVIGVGKDGEQKLVQTRKWKVRLALNSRGRQNLNSAFSSPVARGCDQRGFADACLAANYDRSAALLDAGQ